MIIFLNITVQCKGGDDFRSFLEWADAAIMVKYKLRGYGDTPGKAADDAWTRFNEDRDGYVCHEEQWV